MRRWILSAMALAGALAASPVPAQEVRPPREGEPGVEVLRDVIISRRARLGLKVNLQARESDSVGAYVDLVTPGGPAAQAGLRAGDVITRLDGQPLLDAVQRRDRGRSLPGLRLIRLAARLDAGDTVAVEYRRGAERRSTTLVTDADQLVHLEGRQLPRAMALRVAPGPPGMPALGTRPFELPAPAFGTQHGVLVISAPRNSPLRVRGGDVVLAVDGREPDGPQHLLRILRSYDGGEPFRLEIMRGRKRESLTASLADPAEER
jgi:S1-C subfamily serine protease